MAQTHSYWPDIIGLTGTAILIIAYFLLQREKISGTSYPYLVMNLTASAFIAYSLIWSWNLASFIVQAFWIAISIYGIVRKYKAKL